MQTDGFSPRLVKERVTRGALDALLDRTSLRIRVLTKNSIVGSQPWVDYFCAHPTRFVVGLSVGTLDHGVAQRLEVGTSLPKARLRCLPRLHHAGVPIFGMLCPVLPDVLDGDQLERLLDHTLPTLCETVWAEPYNNRANFDAVRDAFPVTSAAHAWFTDVYEHRNHDAWSTYATTLYLRIRAHAEAHGWLPKLRYLLYEDQITERDAPRFTDLAGVLLQSKPAADGKSRNPYIRQLQLATETTQ